MREIWMLGVVGAIGASIAFASDRWESQSDDGAFTNNALHHGVEQGPHDFESPDATPDEDWYEAVIQLGHSYEIRVFGGAVWRYQGCPGCATFDRVDGQGNVLVPGSTEGLDEAAELAVRWIGDYDGIAQFRAAPGSVYPGATQNYDVALRDTTLFLPRFNNATPQATTLVIQSTLDRPTQGEIRFFDATGALLHTRPMTLPARGVSVINTAQIPALAGKAGSAWIAHLGGVGGLAGKAVSVDAAAGLAFDTPLASLP